MAALLTFAVHLVLLLGGRSLHLFETEPVAAQDENVLEVVFAPSPGNDPTQFTELPPDRAEESPDDADLLSNIDSRARDLTGGEGDTPCQDGRSDAPQVQMDRGALPSFDSAEATESDQSSEVEHSDETAPPRKQEPTPDPIEDNVAVERSLFGSRPPPSDPFAASRQAPAADPVSPGNSDIAQEASYSPVDGTLLGDDFSLSTTAWDYAPWVLHFRRQLTENWVAPMGYHLGLISGWTLVEVEVSLMGEISKLEVLDESGHVAFRSASVGAIERSQPLLPLPEGFPDPSLVLRIRLNYPDQVRRSEGVRRPTGLRGAGR